MSIDLICTMESMYFGSFTVTFWLRTRNAVTLSDSFNRMFGIVTSITVPFRNSKNSDLATSIRPFSPTSIQIRADCSR